MLTHVCVAIQLLGTPAAPDAVRALQQRCEGILGAGECRLAAASTPDGDRASAAGKGGDACWRATVARTGDDAAASVVVSAPGAVCRASRPARADVPVARRGHRALGDAGPGDRGAGDAGGALRRSERAPTPRLHPPATPPGAGGPGSPAIGRSRDGTIHRGPTDLTCPPASPTCACSPSPTSDGCRGRHSARDWRRRWRWCAYLDLESAART